MEEAQCSEEYKHILLKIVGINGFDKQLIHINTRIFRRLKHVKESTTLSSIDNNVTYKKLSYNP